jgi:hypothetical protein
MINWPISEIGFTMFRIFFHKGSLFGKLQRSSKTSLYQKARKKKKRRRKQRKI